MHDPKFEKEVQQKMSELEFSPSAAVWANVEKALQKRERRGLPFFWRLALPALLLLLAGGGYYFFTARTTPAASPAVVSTTQPHTAPAPAATTVPATTVPATTVPATTVPATTAPSHSASIAAVTPAAASAVTPAASAPRPDRRGRPSPAQPGNSFPVSSGAEAFDPVSETETTTTTTTASVSAAAPERDHSTYNPALVKLNTSRSAISAKQPTPKSAALQNLKDPKHPWEAAFVGGAGVSSLHQIQLSNVSLMASSPAPANASFSTGVTQSAATPSKNYVSTVKSGPSFWAGVEAYRQLSPQWGLSIGLDLHYYSNIVHIGQQVNSYTPQAASLLTSQGFAPIQSYPYYSAGNDQTYTNKYYFLEMPVALEWKLNHSRLLPIFLTGGGSLSYLMGSSAVYYNTHSGVYFKDGGVANKMQVNLSSALMVGLPFRDIRIQLGPQIQYGLMSLLNTEQSGEQHIFYGGIRVVVFPGKK